MTSLYEDIATRFSVSTRGLEDSAAPGEVPEGLPGPAGLGQAYPPADRAPQAVLVETHARTLVKSLTWRLGGLLLTVLTAWLITRRVDIAASIGLADTGLKVIAFYAHERLWLRVRFGRQAAGHGNGVRLE